MAKVPSRLWTPIVYITINKSVGECKRPLSKLSDIGNEVTLNWILGHSRQLGNGIVDG